MLGAAVNNGYGINVVVGVGDAAVVAAADKTTDRSAASSGDAAVGGIGVGDGAAVSVPSDHAADETHRAVNRAGGIGVGDGAAGVPPDQSADSTDASHCAIGVGGSDSALVHPDQSANLTIADYADISQSNVAQDAAGSQCADEADISVGRLVHAEIGQCVSATVQFTCRKYWNVPVRRR